MPRLRSEIPKITLVVNTFEAPETLEKVLLGIRFQTVVPHQTIVADDGSGPATAQLLEAWRPKLAGGLLHVWQPHEGFRRARILNEAIARATGEYVVFLDGDCPPHDRFIEDHGQLAEPGMWVQARRCFVKEPHVSDFVPGRTNIGAWALSGKLEQAIKAFRTPWVWIRRDRDLRGIIGCNLGIWREDLKAINGYDESFTGWGREDSDLGARLYHLGRTRKFVRGRAIVFHLNHPPASRSQLESNEHRLAETLRVKRVRAVDGLDGHPDPQLAPRQTSTASGSIGPQ
jgi:glycosyltransferase involved in cell wall biosynthesis